MQSGEPVPEPAMSVCVIFNPQAGRRRARRRLARFLARWQTRATFWPTEYAGHGFELGQRAAESGFGVVAAAGGDGTAHEVANGVLCADRHDVTFAVVPIGSANDYAWSLKRQFGVAKLDDDAGSQVDVGRITATGGRERFVIECLGMGLSSLVTLEARRIKRLQGVPLYGLAAWRALRHSGLVADLNLRWDDAAPVRQETLLLTVLVGSREGNFLLAPDALLDDGLFDFVHASRIGRWEALAMLPRLAVSGPPRSHPAIRLGRCRSVGVESDGPLTIHTDGEMFCVPDDAIHAVDIRLLPARLRVKLCAAS